MLPIGEKAYWILFYSLIVLGILGSILFIVFKVGKGKDK